MIAYTRILGAVYVLSPLRVAYAVESMGPHCIPASDAARDIRQLPCFAKGGHLPDPVHACALYYLVGVINIYSTYSRYLDINYPYYLGAVLYWGCHPLAIPVSGTATSTPGTRNTTGE